ncbi:MAG: O-antigen ligase family protein [Acidobacteria bacterium]|nr:O-antigen ligase family protein [Acidobacteriota bacterium]MDA1237172.1 O-antigen ligase family protein [Acidobacteriota bacterium]
MNARSNRLEALAYGFAFFASVLGFASIAASQICLGAAVALWLAARKRFEMPPLKGPLLLFMGWTIIAAIVSVDHFAALPQIKKMLGFAMLPVIYTLFRTTSAARRLMEAWFAIGFITVSVSFVQFYLKWRESIARDEPFLLGYLGDRITGLMSHWMTFSETTLLILVVLGSYVLFRDRDRRDGALWSLLTVWLAAGIVLSWTRSAWIAMAGVGAYLVWFWKPRLLWLAPIALMGLPFVVSQEVTTRVDSRVIMWRTGVRMIQDHPWFGVGPERVGPTFMDYLPPDVPKELPVAYYAHLHNTFVHYAAERGLPIVLALLWLFGKVLWDMSRALRRLPPGPSDERFLLHAAITATIALLIVGMSNVSMGDSEVLDAWLGVVAVGYRAAIGNNCQS